MSKPLRANGRIGWERPEALRPAPARSGRRSRREPQLPHSQRKYPESLTSASWLPASTSGRIGAVFALSGAGRRLGHFPRPCVPVSPCAFLGHPCGWHRFFCTFLRYVCGRFHRQCVSGLVPPSCLFTRVVEPFLTSVTARQGGRGKAPAQSCSSGAHLRHRQSSGCCLRGPVWTGAGAQPAAENVALARAPANGGGSAAYASAASASGLLMVSQNTARFCMTWVKLVYSTGLTTYPLAPRA